MALRKRNTSSKVTKAEIRLEAMKKLDQQLERIVNYGGDQNPLTTKEMNIQIEECKMLINEYNFMLELVDKKSKDIRHAEEKLGDLFTRVLAGCKSIFGVDSDEIALLGGTKRSERKKISNFKK
jgi:hypothetical protein